MKEIATPSATRAILDAHQFAYKKSLGQNFLVDPNILQRIVRAAELGEHQAAIEVGPGVGALTAALAQSAAKVLAFEIDQRLIPILNNIFSGEEHVKIVHQDVLKADLRQEIEGFIDPGQSFSVVANLPYYATTPILLHFLEEDIAFEHMVVMVQKEVAERLTAHPGRKEYGSLSVLIQYYTEPSLVMTVPKTVFIPQPKVDSAVLKLTRRKRPPVNVDDSAHFFRLIRAGFASRRKTLANNILQQLLSKKEKATLMEVLEKVGIDPGRRGETLTMEEFACLSNALVRTYTKPS